jgi:hypothetical protein
MAIGVSVNSFSGGIEKKSNVALQRRAIPFNVRFTIQ